MLERAWTLESGEWYGERHLGTKKNTRNGAAGSRVLGEGKEKEEKVRSKDRPPKSQRPLC